MGPVGIARLELIVEDGGNHIIWDDSVTRVDVSGLAAEHVVGEWWPWGGLLGIGC